MRMSTGVILVAIAYAATGCGGSSRSVTAPSSVASPQPTAPTLSRVLAGYVSDTAFRPLGGARIEVIDGQQAGMVLTSEANGSFSYPAFAGSASMRATKEGYASAVSVTILSTDRTFVNFELTSLVPPVRVAAGDYTLTIVADSACTGLPADVRTRTYLATVTPGTSTRAPGNTFFDGFITSGMFAPYANLFWIGVAGDYVAVSTQGEGPSIIEQVGSNGFVTYYGVAAASIGTPEAATISAPFKGSIEYCELKSPVGQYYDCSPELAVVRETCTSTGSQLTLARR